MSSISNVQSKISELDGAKTYLVNELRKGLLIDDDIIDHDTVYKLNTNSSSYISSLRSIQSAVDRRREEKRRAEEAAAAAAAAASSKKKR